MKHFLPKIALSFALFFMNSMRAQVGIGTITPHPSASLDIYSETKGVLMPRLTTGQRDLIVLPAKGLMIYNTTTNDGELNNGTPEAPIWSGMKTTEYASSVIQSVSQGGLISTTSVDPVLVPGMIISPPPGTYMALFNAQMSSSGTSFASNQGVSDVNALYNEIINLPATATHPLVFGTDEVLMPGIYNVNGAASVAGTLTLDGNGDPSSIFIIRSSGAITTAAGTIIVLSNGATANNVFWVSEGTLSTGAETIMKGTLIAHANAVSLGANTNLEGRMFTTAGALTMGASSYLVAPAGASAFSLGVLSTFVMFSATGAISGCSDCGVNGDVGTAAGAATSFESINGTVYLPGTTNTPVANSTAYAIYVNDTEVINATRTFTSPNSNATLQTMVTVEAGQTVEVRWKVDANEAVIANRILSLIRSF